ncbi:MAG TPA: TetR/AcrR family transcriptional regulator [Mycobacteriales bacterium]|jgi:AcrR family transcriptional regulator|nr:TetR/AcrR family transcriptional regulator [Mycobacteriales bacterium]
MAQAQRRPAVPAKRAATPRGGRLPRNARRAQLLTAAQEIFVAQGYHAALMDDIAEHAGVSKPVLYQHFPSKLDLYLALLDEHVGALVRQVRAALEATDDNRDRVRGAIGTYFDFVEGDGAAYRLVFESDLRNEPAVSDRVEHAMESCVTAIADTIAKDTGVGAAEARLLSVGLTGLAEVTARWWLASGGEVPKERAVELLSALAWRGLSRGPRTT